MCCCSASSVDKADTAADENPARARGEAVRRREARIGAAHVILCKSRECRICPCLIQRQRRPDAAVLCANGSPHPADDDPAPERRRAARLGERAQGPAGGRARRPARRRRRCLDAGVSARRGLPGLDVAVVAAYYGHAEVVRLLLERGANPKARNRAGRKARDVTAAATAATAPCCAPRSRTSSPSRRRAPARPREAGASRAGTTTPSRTRSRQERGAQRRRGGGARAVAKGAEVDRESALGAAAVGRAQRPRVDRARAADGGADARARPRARWRDGVAHGRVRRPHGRRRGRARRSRTCSARRGARTPRERGRARLRRARARAASASRTRRARARARRRRRDARDLCGHTPLWYASKYGHPALVEMLLRLGGPRARQAARGDVPGYCATRSRARRRRRPVARRIEVCSTPRLRAPPQEGPALGDPARRGSCARTPSRTSR